LGQDLRFVVIKNNVIHCCGFTTIGTIEKNRDSSFRFTQFGMTSWFVIEEEESSGAQSAPLLSSSRTIKITMSFRTLPAATEVKAGR